MANPAYNVHSFRLKDFSPDQLQEAIQGGQFEHYILSGARCDAQVDHWSHGDFAVDTGRYSFPVRITGSFPVGKVCFGYMRRLTAPTWVNGWSADDRTMEFYPMGTELNYRAAPRGGWVSITFQEAALQAAAHEQLGRELNLPRNNVISFRVPSAERYQLDQMVRRLCKGPFSGPAMIRPILRRIAEFLDAVQNGSLDTITSKARRRYLLLQRSDHFLRNHIDDPFDIESLAAATATTARTLQRAFQEAYGVTPHQWARCHALHRVRRRLQSSEAGRYNIEGVAREFGFRHMGRFAKYYRELFGELPSESFLCGPRLSSVQSFPGQHARRGR